MKNLYLNYYSNTVNELYFDINSNGYKTYAFYVGMTEGDEYSDRLKIYATYQTDEGSDFEYSLNDAINMFDLDIHQELSYLKNLKLIQINLAYDDAIKGLTKMTPDAEMSTWTLQKIEADMYDVTKKAPFLEKLASIRGITLDELIAKVKAKNAIYVETVGNITGYRQKLEDKIMKATSVEDIKAVEWNNTDAITPINPKPKKSVSKK